MYEINKLLNTFKKVSHDFDKSNNWETKSNKELHNLFYLQCTDLVQAGNLLIATNSPLKELPKSVEKLFASSEEKPYETIIPLNYPHDEKYPFFLDISFNFIVKNQHYYVFQDSASGEELTDFKLLLTFADLFTKFRLTQVQAKQLLHDLEYAQTDNRIITTKVILKEIAKIGLCCAYCFIDRTIKYAIMPCCSKMLCKKCWRKKNSFLARVCPLCESNCNPNWIDPMGYIFKE